MKFRRAAPVLLVFLVSVTLMHLRPTLAVWCSVLLLPFFVGASLFVERWWSATPPHAALITAALSAMPAMHHCRVFNVEGETILAWATLFALVPLPLVFAVARRAPLMRQLRIRRAVFALIAAGSAYGYGMGAAYFADTFFDHGPVKPYRVTVKARLISSYFGFIFKRYDLNVTPWGSHTTVDSVIVDPDLFDDLRTGDHIRLELSPGLLNIPWVRATGRITQRADAE